MTFRTLGSDHQFSESSSVTAAEQLRAAHAGRLSHNSCALRGRRQVARSAPAPSPVSPAPVRDRQFDVVTGVSAGALVAPYAFLGPSWDAQLLDAFTGAAGRQLAAIPGTGRDVRFECLQRQAFAATDRRIRQRRNDPSDRAREADKGRLLLVATTDVASGEPVVWDLGAIAKTAVHLLEHCFATCWWRRRACPACFRRSLFGLLKDGVNNDQAHVDGAATVPFFVPPLSCRRREASREPVAPRFSSSSMVR